jgi:hypothetical protein
MKNKSKIMKVLTVKQPWTYLICSGIKDIENRTWKLPEKYKGERVLIHASGNPLTWEQFCNYIENIDYESHQLQKILRENNFSKLWLKHLNTSAIIGSVRFVDCTFNHHSIWAEKSEGIATGGHVINVNKPIIWNWVVADPVLFDRPILNVKGKLSFWDYEMGSVNGFISN